ncbi:MAG: integrase [Frankiales bacterium]|nr:integrase [Frankiales bacterium]
MPSNATALLPAGLVAGDIPNLSLEQQAVIGFFSELTNERTKVLYRHSLKVYFDWCGREDVDVMAARPVQLRLYQTWLASTDLAESTRSRMFGVVSVFYKKAVIDELILRDPTLGIKRVKVDKAKQHRTWLQPLEFARFLSVARAAGPHPYAMFTLLGEVALRAEEACNLRIEPMTRVGGQEVIRFIGKGGKAATMQLTPSVGEIVRAAIGDRTTGTVVLNTEGNPYTPNSLWRLTKKLAVAADVDPAQVSPHTFRRTCAFIATVLNVPVHQTQAHLRHEDSKTTQLYIGPQTGMDQIAALQVSTFVAKMTG